MATYAIGDVQGCYDALQRLLQLCQFDPANDQLWLAGDLVNRGEDSLACLRLLYRMGGNVEVVLGNHDLHLLAVARGHATQRPKDTLTPILEATDRDELLGWLQQQPLMLSRNGWMMSHAGMYPLWTFKEARQYAEEVQTVLQSDKIDDFLAAMYGNTPTRWQPELSGVERLRFITNAFTRMRFITPDGDLDMVIKENADQPVGDLIPWFSHDALQKQLNHSETSGQPKLLFGHWAALMGDCPVSHIFALDTGCVWGGQLTALRLEDQQRFSVDA